MLRIIWFFFLLNILWIDFELPDKKIVMCKIQEKHDVAIENKENSWLASPTIVVDDNDVNACAKAFPMFYSCLGDSKGTYQIMSVLL